MVQDEIHRDAPGAGIAKQTLEARLVEETQVFRVVVRLRRNRDEDEAATHAKDLPRGTGRVGEVFEDLEDGDPIERAFVEGQCRHVGPCRVQSSDAATVDGLEVACPEGIRVDGGHRQERMGIEQRPQESATSTADVEERLGGETGEGREHAPNPWKVGVALELVEPEAARDGLPEHEDVVTAELRESAARERGGEREVVAALEIVHDIHDNAAAGGAWRYASIMRRFGCALTGAVLALAAGVACGRGLAEGAPTGSDAGPDAPDVPLEAADAGMGLPKCAWNTPFGRPQPLAAVNEPGAYDGHATLSDDEKVIYFQTTRGPGRSRLFMARRETPQSAFGVPAEIALSANSADSFDGPSLSRDRTRLVYSQSDVLGVATRTGGDAVEFVPGPSFPRAGRDINPFFAADDRVWFAHADGTATSSFAIWSTHLLVDGFASARREVSDGHTPLLSRDGKTLYFFRAGRVHRAHRQELAFDFSDVDPVSELNDGGSIVLANWLSVDECRLYLSISPLSDAAAAGSTGGYELHVATRSR